MTEKTLYQQIAETIGVGDSAIVPDIVAMLADENEAKVILAASPPALVSELAEKTGIPEGEVDKMMGPLFQKGLIFKSKKPEGTKYYRARSLLQFHDATILAENMPQEFFDAWKRYNDTEFKDYHKAMESILDQSPIRVIPVNIAIDAGSRVAHFEDVKRYVEESNSLAVTKCTCRVVDGACGLPLEVCIQINRAADYAVERGTGRSLTKDEAIEMLKMCEEEGLIHTVFNNRSLGHIICNCCGDCCINWPGPRHSGVNFSAPSRFCAQVDEALCTGCETCLDRCYFDAIKMEDDVSLIIEDNCMGCGLCVVTCPDEAITMKEVRAEDYVPE